VTDSLTESVENELIVAMEEAHSVAIIGDSPEALLLSVLYGEAGIPNYLVGPFGDDGRTHANRPGIEEALWLLGILRKSGKVKVASDYRQLPLSQIRTLIMASHASNHDRTSALELIVRNMAPALSTGTTFAFAGLCSPRYTTLLMLTVERYAGLKAGTDLNFYYIPLFWRGERIQDFREHPKILAAVQGTCSGTFQRELLQVFPSLSVASSVEVAEASGLFSAIRHEVGQALGLELARISEGTGINIDQILELCKDSEIGLSGRSTAMVGRESIGTEIALSNHLSRRGPRLVRAAHSINQEYQSQIVDLIRRALNHCGYPLRRSKVAILGTDGLLKNSWSKPESPPLVQSLRRKGAVVSLYPGEKGSEPWTRMVGESAQIESSLLKAVAKADCTVIALPRSYVPELDADQLATEMNRPGAICDLTRVLEASNVERAGLFYTTIGRGTLKG
jgi:UDP-N-acetyl-D-mannosaminuronate dehydrogenase